MKQIKWLIPIIFIFGSIYCLRFLKIENNIDRKANLEETIDLKVQNTLQNLSLEEKIGQMLIIQSRVPNMTDDLKNILENLKPGGFILFKENFTNYSNTLQLINDIEKSAAIPMIIGIDQEGGRVQRLKEIPEYNISKIPTMQKVGTKKNEKLSYDLGKVIAEELQVFGINMNFAPVLDIVDTSKNQVIGDRSFGNDIELVSNLGIAIAKGLEDNYVLPVYKHFPGHGSTEVDSHFSLPILTKSKQELFSKELVPFQRAINANAKIIMVGHIAVPNISRDNTPASLSREVITDLLKEEMHFNGLVITDALNMKAITNDWQDKEIYEKAINAGVDLLLMPNNPQNAPTLIKELIKEQKITEDQINNSVRKILTTKYENLSNKKLSSDYLGNEEHQKIISQLND